MYEQEEVKRKKKNDRAEEGHEKSIVRQFTQCSFMSSKNKFVVSSFLLTYTQGFGNEVTTYNFAAEGPQQYTVR